MRLKILMRTIGVYIRTLLGRYVPARRYKQIFREIEKRRPQNIMEVGTWNGNRAREMIWSAGKYRPISEVNYFGYDLFETMTRDMYQYEISKIPPREKDVQEKLTLTGANISLFTGYTTDTMQTIDQLPKMDFVFIDGGHATDTVLNDWRGVQKIMHRDTVVIFDDYWHNRNDGPRVVIDSIDRNVFNVEILPIVDVFFNPDFGRMVISLVKVTFK